MKRRFLNLINAKIPLGLAVLVIFLAGAGVTGLLFFKGRAAMETLKFLEIGRPEYFLDFGAAPSMDDPDVFAKTKKRLLEEKVDFIEANLSDMTLKVWKNGEVAKEVKILAKGREGSWWETPSGIYKIQSKEKSHFSSFGHVYQPWSMAFQGNFFIHGWPYYEDGTPVSSTYSGGCIRLSDEDAAAVYDLVSVGTPVVVFKNSFSSDGFAYAENKPVVLARSYLAADIGSNFVILESGSAEKYSIASITKLLTGLVVAEFINLDKDIDVPEEAIIETTKPRFKADESVSAYNLLFPLLMESSNEAAEIFASRLGKERFVGLMNAKAKAIGMENTYFADSSGVLSENTSTAKDLFVLAKYLKNNRSFLLNISSGNLKTSAYGEPEFNDLENFNLFADDPRFIGGKVGKSSSANETMLAVFNLGINGEERPVAIIILDSGDVKNDILNIVTWIEEKYR